MRTSFLSASAIAALFITGCTTQSDKVDEGNGMPRTDQKAVVEEPATGAKQVVDDKGNPVLKEDGTPQKVGEKPGKQYQGAIPERFRGAWAINPADCSSGAGQTRIRIGDRSVVFYESTAKVKAVTDENQQTATLDAELTGEGASTPQMQKMTLSPDGKTLIYVRGKDEFRYGKCAG